MAILIDTHKAIRQLEGSGADKKLAEGIVALFSHAEHQVATRADLTLIEERLTKRIYVAALTSVGINIAAVALLLQFFVR